MLFSFNEINIQSFLLHKRRTVVISALSIITCVCSCKKDATLNQSPQNPKLASGYKISTAASLPQKSDALVAMQVFNNTFYNQYGTYGSSYKANYWLDQNKTTKMTFWTQNEAIETLIDAYNINPNADFANKISYLYNGVRDGFGLLWTNNIYNDDVTWGSLMCVREYKITNDGGALTMAQNNFNMMWARAWDTSLGGLWWTTSKTSKNACVNAPAVICAVELYQATGNTTYLTEAKMIMDWIVSKLYLSTGEVQGAIDNNGNITQGALSYTQGTFIGACMLLKSYYPSVNYLGMGEQAMSYTSSSLCITPGGILNDENQTADTQGMKGIFARWACAFVQSSGTQSTYGPWLDANATQAWSIRNANGLMWNIWETQTPQTPVILNSWQTSCGVAMVNNIYLYH